MLIPVSARNESMGTDPDLTNCTSAECPVSNYPTVDHFVIIKRQNIRREL